MVNDRKIDFIKDPNSIKSLNLLHELQNLIKMVPSLVTKGIELDEKVSNLLT